jgi:hypothetical protein
VNFKYDANSVTQAIFIAPYACKVARITGRPRVAGSGGACTFAFYKCASTIAAASGTLLHSGTFDLVGTADTNQELTLVLDQSALQMVDGDSINVVLTGTPTSAVGIITISVEPLR